MKIYSQPLPDVFVIEPSVFKDGRGNFVKTYHKFDFVQLGIDYDVAEEYYTTSQKNVIRGMHFQAPPHDGIKLIYCINGSVLDVVIDLRKSSPKFGSYQSIELSSANKLMLMVPGGFAHGFLSLEDHTIMVYKNTFVYAPAHDTGIRWDSFGFDWPIRDPITSERDRSFSSLADCVSPFP
ncbi:MAG: dTDP-4-dehydrorhamnose 3,5-epimerase [Methylacidiphilales bacterium]|nr:dTDP-4-dehydrorhamnose 3,5-epimerase [Candidatus Methylacidiphilales bacterium]